MTECSKYSSCHAKKKETAGFRRVRWSKLKGPRNPGQQVLEFVLLTRHTH